MNWTRGEAAAEHAGRGLDRERLREARDALDQEVALGEEADEDALEHLVLPRDHAPDLEERLLEPVADLGGRGRESRSAGRTRMDLLVAGNPGLNQGKLSSA